jgi:hypothetical protein
MPPEDRLRLHEKDSPAPRWQQSRGEEKSKSVCWTHARSGRAAAKHTELVAKGGILEHELASGAPAEVGGDSERASEKLT